MVTLSNNIRPFVQAYTNSENWRYINDLEDYKWYAIRHFQEHFFEEGVPFPIRLAKSLGRTENLLIAPRYYPQLVLIEVCNDKPETTEALLNGLFNESMPLRDRINTYISEFDKTIELMATEGHSDWKGRDNVQSFQDAHAVSVYLAMRYPQSYYIYKYGIFRDFSNIIGYKIENSNAIDRYIEYNSLCDEVKKELLREVAFISFYDGWLKANELTDSNYNLLTQDFIYAVVRYLDHAAYGKDDKKKPIERGHHQIEAREFTTVEPKMLGQFKGIKNIDYAKKDELYRGIGLLGEQWAITYEQERLAGLGIKHEVRHSSVLDGDGIGYDIESVEDDGVTPRYIEVKTTTGSFSQPFYYSDNELQFSEYQKEHYYVYRIFNFKNARKQADLLIIHGSLKELNGKPVNYKVSIKK